MQLYGEISNLYFIVNEAIRNLWMKYIGSLLPFNRYVNLMN